MTILSAGSFRVSDFRKPIPRRVELAVLIRQECKADDGVPFKENDAIEFDHDPSLDKRDYDTVAGDFIPPQHDPTKIVAKRKGKHLEKTTGRKEGAAKTVTTRGSDIGERARTRNVRDQELLHQAAMIAKGGDIPRAEAYLGLLSDKAKRRLARPKRKIQSRGFVKGHRTLRSRNDLRRAKRW